MTSIEEFNLLRIPLDAIKLATNNFNAKNYINKSKFGENYKGELVHRGKSVMVAIKCLDRTYGRGASKFRKEVMMLSRYRHENLVSLLGFCDEGEEKILVYEDPSNKSLDMYLSDPKLTWIERLKICTGAACGLQHLHNPSGTTQRVLHGDIKSSNILLDENWKAKISDFGLSTLGSANKEHTFLAGTLGYIDPLYYETGFLTKESDIYSFGVVLFEVLCGMNYNNSQMLQLVQKCYEQNKIGTIVSDFLRDQIEPNCLQRYADIAYQCLRKRRNERPSIAYIVQQLGITLQKQDVHIDETQHDDIEAIKIQRAYRLYRKRKQMAAAALVQYVSRIWKTIRDHVQKIRLEEILSATDHFSDENLINEGELGKLYRGRLSRHGKFINIVARRLNRKYGLREIMFKTEISMISSLQHENIISFLGFVDEKDEKIVIYKLLFHGILEQHASDPTLNWSQRLQICLGVARALNHIHYDIIHCDINSSKIFLDQDWEPKLFGFEFSTKYPQSWRHRLQYSCRFSSTSLTPKFDVYCFGVLMFEILSGRKPTSVEDVVNEEVDDIIHPELRKQMGTQSLTSFLKTAKTCLKKEPAERPTMDQIIKELGETMELQSNHENHEHSAAADEDSSIKRSKMDIMKIPLNEIKRATDNFQKGFVGQGGYGMVYQAQLDVLDIQDMSSIEGKCKDELPKTSKNVAIKRITERHDEQGKEGFLTEIELLTRCKHPNIVPLLGFSEEKQEMILVYEYVSEGSLSDYFERTTPTLTWVQRIQISLDIAKGINYLHTDMEGKQRILHRDIKSQNILLDENLKAKVADFGLSRFHPKEQQASTIYTNRIVGTQVYLDPEYLNTGKYKKESDVYSFGVVLFEILSGRLAYDKSYMMENNNGLGPIAWRRYNEGTLKELIDPKIIEDDEHIFTINRGPNEDSFNAFSKIAYQCLAETQAKRPTMEGVIKELENALKLQGETIVLSKFQLSDIVSATKNFSEAYCICAYGMVYKAELDKILLATEGKENSKLANACITVDVKRISSRERFFSEIEMHISYNNHSNIVPLLGFCDEEDEMILLYEHASNKSLDDYLKRVDKINNLTWAQRLRMCLDIARGINHIHTKMDPQQHGDIRSANILLGNNWEAKIAYFVISNLQPPNQDVGLQVYWDPEYEKAGKVGKESDIYSFGVVMFEIFCGRLAYDQVYMDKSEKGLAPIARQCFNDGTIKEMIDPELTNGRNTDEYVVTLKRRPNKKSLDTFLGIAYRCLGESQADRPTMEIVIQEFERALKFQVSQY